MLGKGVISLLQKSGFKEPLQRRTMRSGGTGLRSLPDYGAVEFLMSSLDSATAALTLNDQGPEGLLGRDQVA